MLANILYNVEEEDLEEVIRLCEQLLEKKLKDGTKKVFEALKDEASYIFDELNT